MSAESIRVAPRKFFRSNLNAGEFRSFDYIPEKARIPGFIDEPVEHGYTGSILLTDHDGLLNRENAAGHQPDVWGMGCRFSKPLLVRGKGVNLP